MSATRLVYIMGPSGVGKDSILNLLQSQSQELTSPDRPHIRVAKRTIDRDLHPDSEVHEAVSPELFVALANLDAFAMVWRANGHQYGIRHEELHSNEPAAWLLINGSRSHWQDTARWLPNMRSVLITATPDTLRHRLETRARDDAQAIEQRLNRLSRTRTLDVDWVLSNDDSLEVACQRFWAWLAQQST